VEEGIVAGGGTALINVMSAVEAVIATLEGDEKTGASIVLKSLMAPMKQIADNAGLDGAVIIAKIRESGKVGFGFDAYKEAYCDMMEVGIVEPAKVTRCALQNAASIASTVLTTEAVVSEKKEEKPAMPQGAEGGMGGMY
jgi:chaperonin GroEL